MKGLISFFVLISLISLISATGLEINPNNLNINKTNGIDYQINFNITNSESYKFYNITSQNSILTFPKLDLDSGQTAKITGKINSNEFFDGQIKIIGNYYANLGQSNSTERVNIESNGVDICDLNLIVGDKIIWKNTLSSSVKLKNLNTGEYFSTLNSNQEYEETFLESKEFDYQVFRTGLPFSQVCHLNIMPTEGYIHNSNKDAILNLNLDIIYEPTTITSTFLEDNYELEYNSEYQDLFSIKNTGSKIAKNIKLVGEWLEFTDNNFDLSAGQSKTIGYTIKPNVFLTNQTNKSYTKKIIISGNFNTLEKELNIFIKYKDLSFFDGNMSYDKETLIELVKFVCSVYPDDCPKIVVYGNESNRNVTFTITEDSYYEKIQEDSKSFNDIMTTLQSQNEKLSVLENKTNTIESNNNLSTNKVVDLSEKTDNFLGFMIFAGIGILFVACLVILLFLGFKYRIKSKINKSYFKGEKNW